MVVEMASTNVLITPTGSFGSSNIVPEVGLASTDSGAIQLDKNSQQASSGTQGSCCASYN